MKTWDWLKNHITIVMGIAYVPKVLSGKQKALMCAYAELEEDTPGQVQGVSFDRDGKKISISEPHDLVDAVKEALKEKKSIEGSPPTTPEDDDLKETKRSKG